MIDVAEVECIVPDARIALESNQHGQHFATIRLRGDDRAHAEAMYAMLLMGFSAADNVELRIIREAKQ